MNRKLIVSAILSVLSLGAVADTPSFDNVEIGYTNWNLDDDFSISGVELKGSAMVTDNFYIAGDFSNLSKNGNGLTFTTIGVGYKFDFSDNTSFFAEIDYARFDGDGGFDADGFEITSGVRSMLTEKFEIKAAIEYLEIDNTDSTSFIVGAAYDVTDSIAIYADYKIESDVNRFGIGARFNF